MLVSGIPDHLTAGENPKAIAESNQIEEQETLAAKTYATELTRERIVALPVGS